MSWFIFSEVMFFAAFFGALFYARVYSVPDLATIESNALIWPGFTAHWPSAGPISPRHFSADGRLGHAGAQHADPAHLGRDHHLGALGSARQQPQQADLWLGVTIALGVVFLGLPGYEYAHAYGELNLKLTPGSTARRSSC